MIIRITPADGGYLSYKETEDHQFNWSVGMAGELIIYFKKKHKIISATTEEGIDTVYAAGQWLKVENVPED